MSESRQLCPQIEGAQLANYITIGKWDVVPNADYAGLGCAYFQIQDLDLRGLVAGNERGLYLDTVSLQESLPWTMPVEAEGAVIVCYDMLTTVRPTRHTLANVFIRPDTCTSVLPGFLFPASASTNDWPPSEQTLNPSQVIWGVWRVFSDNTSYKLTPTWGKGLRVLQSSYFGQGDYVVAPSLCWTRIVVTMEELDTVCVPSANLLCNARAENITTPMEVSQMMRAAQR